jgi:ligand-binding sensor domain-containing protein
MINVLDPAATQPLKGQHPNPPKASHMNPIPLTALLLSLLLFSCTQPDTTSDAHPQALAPQPEITSERAGYTVSQLKAAATAKVPMSMVRNVRLDRRGNILVASYLGVYRYEGDSFTHLTRAFPSPSFWDVLEDRGGNLWLATKDSGAYRFDGRTLQHFTTRQGLVHNRVMKLYEDRAGQIWLGTGGGLSRYNGKTFQNFTLQQGLSYNDMTTIMEDKTGRLWLGTRGEACFYDGKAFTIFKDADGDPFYNVWSFVEDSKGNIWFSDAAGLWRYDGSTFTQVSQRAVHSIIQDRQGNIWTTGKVSPHAWALSRYDAKTLYDPSPVMTVVKLGERTMYWGIQQAQDGSIWWGSSGPGSWVHRVDGETVTDF